MASGYPACVRKPADEDLYIESFWNSERIRLDIETIKPNAAKCGLAKLCIISMWGNLMVRIDRTRTKLITELHELYRFLATPSLEVKNLAFASDDVVWCSWKLSADKNVPNLPHTNVVIGAYVTAGGRIYLYIFLDRLQENTIYCDTDCVIFIQPSVEPWSIAIADKLRGHAIFTKTLRIYSGVCIRRSKNKAYRLFTNEGKNCV